MRYFLPAVFTLTLAAISSPAIADDLTAEPTLKAATVFTDRATLTKTAKLEIPAGKHVIIFKDQSNRLYPDSLRIEGSGTAKATLGALSSKIVNTTELTSERENEMNTQLEALQNQKKIKTAEKQAIAARREFFKSLQAEAIKKTNDEIAEFNLDADQWTQTANLIQTNIAETLKADIELDTQIADIDKNIAKITNDLNQIRTGSKQTYEIRIPVEAQTSGSMTLELSYQVPNATWTPVYDARLDTQNGTLKLVQYGAVTQRTGEDWSDVALTLSTARPQRGATAPTLNPMWVSIYSGAKRAGGHNFSNIAANVTSSTPPTGVAYAPESDSAEDSLQRWRNNQEERLERELSAPTATINTGGFTAEFAIPGAITIPADGTETKVLITNYETDMTLETQIKPQLDHNAYLVAKTKIQGEAPVLPGPVSLFRDGAFVGQTSVPLLRPQSEHDLSFGIDDQIKVTHKTQKDERGESGLIVGKNTTMQRHTVTEIENTRSKDVNLAVLQTIPVSKDEKIELSMSEENTTAGYEEDYQKTKGLLRWAFTLKPQEKKDINLGWELSWPKDSNISGVR